jgi:CMP-N,N'-diacetyllegionaminic acid synthase
MNILITICGRAGSKGVKSKNIREFHGIPLIYYTIASAKLFKERNQEWTVDICVNSDSEQLLGLVEGFEYVVGVSRPLELAQDDSPKVPVIIHSMNSMEHLRNKVYDTIIDLDITSPLRRTEDIEKALLKLEENKAVDVVFSVVHARRNPYFNMVEIYEGKPRKIIKSNYVTRQQAPQVFDMNASIYCYRRGSLGNTVQRSPFDGKFDISIMKDTAVLDIDSEDDFELMELLAEYYFANELSTLYEKAREFYHK